MRVLVTGATGKVGRRVALKAINSGATVRALVRDLSRAQDLTNAGIEIVVGNLNNYDDVESALRGMDRAFVLPGLDPPDLHASHVLTSVLSKVPSSIQLVALSCMGANAKSEAPILRWHGVGDGLLTSTNHPIIFIKPAFFLDGLLESRKAILAGQFPNPFGAASLPLIDSRDVANKCSQALLGHDFHPGINELYNENLTADDIVQAFQDELGIRLVNTACTLTASRADFSHPETPEVIKNAGDHFGEYVKSGLWKTSADPLKSSRNLRAFLKENRHEFRC